MGLYWETVKTAFARIEEAPPIPAVIERHANVAAVQEIEFLSLPPLRRTWLLSEDGRHLIQIQGDRFLFNWKKASDTDLYPSYDQVIEEFDRHLAGFVEFLRGERVGAPTYRQFELSYVNHIGPRNGLSLVGENGALVDHLRYADRVRFLPEPEGVNWTTSYPLPNESGRLHVAAQTAIQAPRGERILRLDITARGIPADPTEVARRPWFDLAHEWITHGFADVTSPVLQKEAWGRTA